MRHPLLRILVALLIGIIMPLCCCQAASFVGGHCSGIVEAAQIVDSCCHESEDESSAPPDNDGTERNAPQPAETCPSCPSCQGSVAGNGAKSEATIPSFKSQWDALATFAFAIVWNSLLGEAQAPSVPPGWRSDPPFLRANRDAQRWYCALIV